MTIVGDLLINQLKCRHVFFDFDGVIKDSVEAKGNCFEKLPMHHRCQAEH